MGLLRFLPQLFCFLFWVGAVSAASNEPQSLLPTISCGSGWTLDGKITLYDQESLSDRINGEAELYFPYGFQQLAYGRYVRGDKAFDLDLYRMGSLLDAFGIYANYRPKFSVSVPLGGEGAATPSQLFFYQGRYFVRIQSTGDTDPGEAALIACARIVSHLLPAGAGKPPELDLLAIPEVVQATVQYNATSLLGYDFFRSGMVADAVISGESARLFIVLEHSTAEAVQSFAAYRAYLRANSGGSLPVQIKVGGMMSVVDPLYGNVVVEQVGRYVFGMVRVKEPAVAGPVMEKLRVKLARYS